MRLESNFVQKQQQTQSMKLAMTQQLSQSIAMLQFNMEDLTAFLEEKALENPLIEIVPGVDMAPDYTTIRKTNNATGTGATDWLEQIADTTMTLADALKEQMQFLDMTSQQKLILLFLIESLDDNGYLQTDVDVVASALLASEGDVLEMLEVLQGFEPAGVGARDAKECILLQIERKEDAPLHAYDVIRDYFEDFANKRWKRIADGLGMNVLAIQDIADFVVTLNPKPGAEFESDRVQYVVPDLILHQVGNELQVSVAKQFLPRMQFQEAYFQMMQATQEKDVAAFLKDKAGEFDWLKKGLEQRESTIGRVGEAIVRHQKDFFLHEGKHLQPLTLKEIAEEIDVHESTVSRAVNGKYMETAHGVYELKYFFSSSLTKKATEESDAGDVSSQSIKNLIQQFVSNENKLKPLSDQKIVEMLDEQDIQVSRRAIAKYRGELNIPSSSKRKRFA
ncbi:RNA polymerase factor sigma-54 [Listeria booriae]|uniref:RNA polymerase factor sigma-54 n=1 Tax=Listeria booriae TaxID=1552123 RepID=A0A7X1CCS3_9LIST|nr:RNA polymerase factor sigma-54 [Listeria booriae]MBC1492664.1 RNA polymerase factor sigma-54 [Listeria booriae]MBC1502450.1 RNA polymerase factor sigma-54 [Listeria booriae]MBC1523479.1 RNA polymerase factor sigma-54 [Listeria booriae]MBC1529742.1 RNA polymerase factor sigma-54 [Listeria booriae]